MANAFWSWIVGAAVIVLVAFGALWMFVDQPIGQHDALDPPAHAPANAIWSHDPAAAFARAEAEGSPLAIMFHAQWCGICEHMERTTFAYERVQEKLTEFVALKVDVGEGHESIVQAFDVMGIPTTVIATPKGDSVITRPGYIGPEAYLDLLIEHGPIQ